jgi:hypothetical protein
MYDLVYYAKYGSVEYPFTWLSKVDLMLYSLAGSGAERAGFKLRDDGCYLEKKVGISEVEYFYLMKYDWHSNRTAKGETSYYVEFG